MATPRLFVEQPLAAGAAFALAPAQAHYVTRVMRRKPGDALSLFNGHDGEWRAEIGPGRKGCAVTVVACARPQDAGADVWLVFAPVKRAPIDLIAEKATELGVAALCPVITRHTEARRVNLDRLRANAIEAAEQCRILQVPEVREPQKLSKLLEQWDPARLLIFADEVAPITSPIEALSTQSPRPLAVLVGPEGGFDEEERALLMQQPFVLPVSLGPRVMRADTAAVACLALVNAVLGDWR